MLRLSIVLFCSGLAAQPQTSPSEAASEAGFVLLAPEVNLLGSAESRTGWTLSDGVLTGRSVGPSPAVLIISSRDFADFELRFEAKVNSGALRVKLRAPDHGPLGVALGISARSVEWLSNGVSAFVTAQNRPEQWSEFRIVVRGSLFRVWRDGAPSAVDLVTPHAALKGKVSLEIPAGELSEIVLRRMRIRE